MREQNGELLMEFLYKLRGIKKDRWKFGKYNMVFPKAVWEI